MNRLDYYLQFKRFQQSREKHFGPLINKALKKQYHQFITALKQGKSTPIYSIDSSPIIEVLQPLYMDSIKYGAKVRAYLNTQKSMAPIGFNDRMVSLMQAYFNFDILNVSEGITDTTREIIQRVFQNAIENGLNINDMIAQLENTELSRARARMIARTETVTAANQAGHFAAADTGLKMNKEWLATMDNRTRRDHLLVDGQIVPFNNYFNLGNITMQQPGARVQENGLAVPAKDIVNCRCTTLYIPVRGGNGRLVSLRPTGNIPPITGNVQFVPVPEKVGFVAAKNIEEAKQRMAFLGVKNADIDRFSKEHYNEMLRAIELVPKKAIPTTITDKSGYERYTSGKIKRKEKEWTVTRPINYILKQLKMKQLLFLALAAILFTSCKKESLQTSMRASATCYVCVFGVVNGNTLPDAIICTEGQPKPNTMDAQGNEYSYLCTKR